MEKIIIGFYETVKILGSKDKEDKKVLARIDTGAEKSSIDIYLASKLKLGPIIRTILMKSASGISRRPVVEIEIELAGTKIKEEFTLADRSHMKYQVLIGQNILKKGFLIDPNKEDDEK